MSEETGYRFLSLLSDRWARSALIGGGVAAAFFLLLSLGLGSVGDHMAIGLLESSLPTIRFMCSAIITATSTVMALMLTALGLGHKSEASIRPEYYRRIGHITTMCVWTLIGAVALLLLLCFPIGESDELEAWYNVVYYAIVGFASLLGGIVVAIILTLRKAIEGLITHANPETTSSIVVSDGQQKRTSPEQDSQ